MAAAEKDSAGRSTVVGVGIGAPGPLDTRQGVVLLTPNLGWANFPLRDRVERGARAARHARQRRQLRRARRVVARRGARRGVRGRAHHRDRHRRRHHPRRPALPRRVRRGRRDRAHDHRLHRPPLQVRQLRLPRGLRVGARHRARARSRASRAAPRPTSPAQTSAATCRGSPPRRSTRRRHEGDDFALEVVRDTAKFLGAGVANLVNIFNPEVVVICGGVTLAGDRLFVRSGARSSAAPSSPPSSAAASSRARCPAPPACSARRECSGAGGSRN